MTGRPWALLLAFALAACGRGRSATPAPSPSPTPAPVWTHVASGPIGPQHVAVVVAPHSGGGSGGAFSFVVYERHAGKLRAMQEIDTPDGGFTGFRIADGRVYARFSSFRYGGADCCPKAHGVAIYDDRGGALVRVAVSIQRDAN